MLFNSFEFIFLFLPIVFFVYFYLNKQKLIVLSKGWLVISSLFFYGYWKLEYLPLILISMIFNYSIGSTLSSYNNLKISKKALLTFGIAGNVLLLGYYKYFDFVLQNINYLLKTEFNLMNIFLPLAISFFTFQQIAYLVDSYKSETKEYDFLNYALFVTFFPQLIAGPIVHHKEMMPQFANLRNKVLNYKNLSIGMSLFIIGLSKKVLIADNLSPIVGRGFDEYTYLNFFEGWFVALAYTFQLYFDFSGYTDMALGISKLFNINIPANFNSPYKALNIQDFWRRWHITLSRFLRDYIYIPIGGNKSGLLNSIRNIIITFLIGGIWHGAAWTFIVWGAMHGIGLAIFRLWHKFNISMPKVVSSSVTFIFVVTSWVIFRAQNWMDAQKILSAMYGFTNFSLPKINKFHIAFKGASSGMGWLTLDVLLIFTCLLICMFIPNSNLLVNKFKPNKAWLCFIAFLCSFGIICLNQISEFLYFQF